MRLLRVVERMEGGAARAKVARRRARRAVGLAWSSDDVRLSAATIADLRPGECVASDVTLYGADAGADQMRVVERVAVDPHDLGIVYDAGGLRVGRVTSIDGTLISYEFDPPPAA